MTGVATGQTLRHRQQEVLGLLAEGLTAHEVAARMRLSYATVRTHVAHLMEALGARNRTHAVAIGFRTGLLR